ncbi:MAG: ComF family protein [Bacteroidetes bacterium]|nr:MAG: ComF family protein [Bacteroidota bacterium]
MRAFFLYFSDFISLIGDKKMKFFSYVIDLFYPRLCQACGRAMLTHERVICNYCTVQLPKTHFENKENNPIEVIFWGRADIKAAASYYKYIKDGKVQHLIHQMKYKGFREVGVYVGEVFGKSLAKSPRFKDIDYIIPVPLHKSKLRKRGFNQSELFARGLAKSMKAEMIDENLYRKVASSTQTKKSRWERYKNVNDIFGIRDASLFENKKLLLVDDVITTGSTIEACASVLNQIDGVEVSVGAMASAAF